jgi:hypothetical protein
MPLGETRCGHHASLLPLPREHYKMRPAGMVGPAGLSPKSLSQRNKALCESVLYLIELGVGFGADRLNGGEANHDRNGDPCFRARNPTISGKNPPRPRQPDLALAGLQWQFLLLSTRRFSGGGLKKIGQKAMSKTGGGKFAGTIGKSGAEGRDR